MLSPQRNDPQFSPDFLSLASTTITWEFTRLFPPSWLKSAEQAPSCAESFYFAYIIFPQRPAVSLCSRCREGWARSRMNGSQLYRGWAMKPLSQVAAAPGQVAFVRAHMHACSIFVPILSRLCLFPPLFVNNTSTVWLHCVPKWALLCPTKVCSWHTGSPACGKVLWILAQSLDCNTDVLSWMFHTHSWFLILLNHMHFFSLLTFNVQNSIHFHSFRCLLHNWSV